MLFAFNFIWAFYALPKATCHLSRLTPVEAKSLPYLEIIFGTLTIKGLKTAKTESSFSYERQYFSN